MKTEQGNKCDYSSMGSLMKRTLLRLVTGSRSRYQSTVTVMNEMTEEYQRQVLTKEEVISFNNDGYLVLRNFLTEEEKRNVKNWGDEIQAWPETANKWFSYFETVNGKKTLCRTENFIPYHEGMRNLIENKITSCISDCFDEPACLFKEKVNYKLPNGGAFPPHQDAPAYVTFDQKLHITAMVAIDEMTAENGCLELVSGRHKEGVLRQEESGNIHPDVVKTMDWKSAPCEAGSIMIFNAFVPHRSAKNMTNKARRVFYLTFNAVSDGGYLRNAYYGHKRKMFPPEAERISGVDYSEGAKIYNLATPITNKKD